MPFGNNYYTLTVTTPTASSYVLTATPTATGNQSNDTACGNFILNQLGQQTVSGTATAASCWGN
jgi:Tfp pilus assembly protein PilE